MIPVEQVLIDDGLLILLEEHAKPFVKVIQTECKMIDGNLRLDDDGKVRLRFDEKNGNMANLPRNTTILWINSAQPDGVSYINFRDYVRDKVKFHAPHVLIITSWNGAYPMRRMVTDVVKLGGKVNLYHTEGTDGTNNYAACIATPKGVIAGNGGVKCSHGLDFTYGHIYKY